MILDVVEVLSVLSAKPEIPYHQLLPLHSQLIPAFKSLLVHLNMQEFALM
jgi:hypothetical protein